MSIKGHATIELTDVNTGRVEIIEEDNLVTNAANLFYKELLHSRRAIESGTFTGGTAGINPPVYDIFGGLLIFDGEIEESVDNIHYPECNLVGQAIRDYSNLSNTKIGSYSSIESGPIEGGFKFVYEFATSQANGEIASICLTPSSALGGIGYGQELSEYEAITYNTSGCALSPQCNTAGHNSGILRGHTAFAYSGYIPRPKSSSATDALICFEDEYLYTIPAGNLQYQTALASVFLGTSHKLVIEKRRLNNYTVSLFEHVSRADIVETYEIALSGDNFKSTNYYYCQYIDGYLYVHHGYLTIPVDGIIEIYKIDFNTMTQVETIHVPNTTGVALVTTYMCVTYNNKLFITGGSRMYMIDMSDGAYSMITMNNGDPVVCYSACIPRIFPKSFLALSYKETSSSSTTYGILIDTRSSHAYRIKCNLTSTYGCTPFYIRDDNFCVNTLGLNSEGGVQYDVSTLGMNPFLLTTINNLSSPVIKTEDKTMKITYTLYEDTGTT